MHLKLKKDPAKKWSIFETKKKRFFNKSIIYIIFECWVVIRNRNREPPAVIRAVLRIHNCDSQKIKQMVVIHNHIPQNFENISSAKLCKFSPKDEKKSGLQISYKENV